MKLATIEKINEIRPIEGADRIELAIINGWSTAIKRGSFSVGDHIIFIHIDTLLDPQPWNEHLHDKNDPTSLIRIKIKKLRNVVSAGVVFPLTILPDPFVGYELGTDVSSLIGVTKYVKQIPTQLEGIAKGDFPSHLVSKTDEDNLLSNIEVLDELKACDYLEIRLKCDGSSVTYIKENDGNFRVCSRNLELLDGDNAPWNMARKYDLQNLMPNGTCIQAEIVGPSINGNNLKLESVDIFPFNYKDLNTGKYLIVDEIPIKDLKPVRLVGILMGDLSDLTLEELQKISNEQKYGNLPAEGIVIRGFKKNKLVYSNVLNKMLSVKVINQNYND